MDEHRQSGKPRKLGGWLSTGLCLLILCACALLSSGCTRRWYRQSADREVAGILQEKDRYPSWAIQQFHVYPDPRARFADPTNPDRPPMPPDDPGAWSLSPHPQRPGRAGFGLVGGTGYLEMLAVWDAENRLALAGLKGEPGNVALSLSETARREEYARTSPPSEGGARGGEGANAPWPYLLNLGQALELGQFNSREFQTRRENLYLTALPVTLERFAFVAQFFAAEEAIREYTGRETPEGQHNRWRLTSGTGFTKQFASGAVLLLSMVNRTVIELFGQTSGQTTSESTLTLDLLQPLLRGGGRAVTLEPLTQTERDLVYEIRSYARFRKEFFVAIAGGSSLSESTALAAELAGLDLSPGSTISFSGYLPTVLRAGQVDNEVKNVAALRDTFKLFEDFKEGGDISQLQVDQVEQNLLQSRSNVLQRELDYRNSLDRFKLQLGLPTNVPLELDDAPLRNQSEQLRRFEQVIDQFETARKEAGRLDLPGQAAQVRAGLRRLFTTAAVVDGTRFQQQIARRWAAWEKRPEKELKDRLEGLIAERGRLLDIKVARPLNVREQQRLGELEFEIDLGQFERSLRDYELEPWKRQADVERRQRLQASLFRDVHHLFSLVLGEARAERFERIREAWPDLPPVCINGVDVIRADLDDALTAVAQAALINRFDLMNARGSLVDAWRKIAVFANGLLGVFNVQYHMDSLSPLEAGKPLAIGGSRTRHQLILTGELPLVRQLERNNYRASLIAYQRQRRELMSLEDRVLNQVRSAARQLRVLAENYTIQKRAVELAYFQVENALDTFRAPPTPTQASGGVNVAANAAALTQQLLNAQRSLPQAQNQLYSTWINYQIARMQLYRDMELMLLDDRGVWNDELVNTECPPGSLERKPATGRQGDRGGEDGGELLPGPRPLAPAPGPAGKP